MFDIDKSIKKLISKPKHFGGRRDWDGDGIINKRDCQPRNVMRQDPINPELCKRAKQTQTKSVTIRVTPEMKEWLKKKGYSITGVFREAIADLGCPPEHLPPKHRR